MIKFNWGTGITVFLGLFLIAAFYFVYFSFQHHNDLVVDNYYEQGANYDEQMAINKRSLPFTDSIRVVDAGQQVEIHIASGLFHSTDTVSAHFYSPSDKRNDHFLTISDFSVPAVLDKSLLARGRYTVKFTWTAEQEKYAVSTDFFVSK